MGVIPTPTNYKTFTFDGENSRSYGVYITGEGVFNAPERNVEMVDIPGRNGAFALDKGNFNNIEVTYPAGIFADTEADFAQAVSDLRNLLCSKVGYVRLEDDYNPNEYRMAIYKSGLDVDHDLLVAGEFDIVFECKPQRYLKSGETAISVTSGDTITNPTRFDAQPLIKTWGYGNLMVNTSEIDLTNKTVGVIQLSPAIVDRWTRSNVYYDGSLMNEGDTITVGGDRSVSFEARLKDTSSYKAVGYTLTRTSANISGEFSHIAYGAGSPLVGYDFTLTYAGAETFQYGETKNLYDDFTLQINRQTLSGGTANPVSVPFRVSFYANSTYIKFGVPAGQTAYDIIFTTLGTYSFGEVTGDSTQSVLGQPTYIDCEIGEAYKMENDVPVSLNGFIDLGSIPPTLAIGENTITYDDTFSSVEVVPRWWQV